MAEQHSFNILFAKKYGIEEAIIFDHLYFWCISNKRNGINCKRLENENFDRYWTYNSYKYFSETFIYINESKVRRVIKKLEDLGFILVSNFNKAKYDQTNWYTVTEKGEEEYINCTTTLTSTLFQNDRSSMSKCKMEGVKMTDEGVQNGRPIPISNTTSNTISNSSESSKIDDFPIEEDFPIENVKEVKKSFKKSDYSECRKIIEECRSLLISKGRKIDTTEYSFGVINKWLKHLFEVYGVEQTKKGLRNSVSNEWLVDTAKYSLTALFSEKIFPKCISGDSNLSISIKKGQTAFTDKERDYSNDEGGW